MNVPTSLLLYISGNYLVIGFGTLIILIDSRSSAVRKQHPYKLLVVGAIPTGSILGKDLFLVRRLRVYKSQQVIRKNLNPTVMVKVS